MTFIANPLYDTAFKYLMEDLEAARILLSELLRKEVIECQIRPQEFTMKNEKGLTLYRIDFSALVREKDGSKRHVLIELQKTWKPTETLRFRQYLAHQYLSTNETLDPKDGQHLHGETLPIVAIYLLGHNLYDLTEPVVYVRRQYLDYNDNLLGKGVPNVFIESLTHDAIFVQLPRMAGCKRNPLEVLLQVFDQTKVYKKYGDRLICLDDEIATGNENLSVLVNRLVKAAASPDLTREMEIEAEFNTELEANATIIAEQKKEIEEITLERDAITQERDMISQERDAITQERDMISQERDMISQERDAITQERDMISQERDAIAQQFGNAQQEIAAKDEEIRRLRALLEK